MEIFTTTVPTSSQTTVGSSTRIRCTIIGSNRTDQRELLVLYVAAGLQANSVVNQLHLTKT
jgi:hypothetical protein